MDVERRHPLAVRCAECGYSRASHQRDEKGEWIANARSWVWDHWFRVRLEMR